MPTIRPERRFDPKILEHSHSRKDYSYHKTFVFGVPMFEAELLFLSKLLDQGSSAKCTAFESVSVRASEKGKDYDPDLYWQDECTFDGKPVTQEGTSPATAMSIGVKTGFVPVGSNAHGDTASAYFAITPNNGMDQFDSVRTAIKQQQRPVSAFIIWFEDWDSIYDPNKSGNGIVPNSFNTQLGGHAVKIAGWKTINGIPYLVVQNSWGTSMGDNGLFYFSREIANRVFGSQGWVYIWSDSANVQIKRLGFFASLLQNLINLIQSLKSQPTNGAEPLYWDSWVSSRHSVRVICDQMGLSVEQKNILCACVQVESNFNPNAIHYNHDGRGKILSTDFGIAQINDYWNIGPGKPFPSSDYVLNNPEACIRFMCKEFLAGNQHLWCSYTSGAYKKYL